MHGLQFCEGERADGGTLPKLVSSSPFHLKFVKILYFLLSCKDNTDRSYLLCSWS